MKRLENRSGTISVKGQHSVLLPVKFGKNRLKITVKKGTIQLNHGCYTPDGGTWLMPPAGNRQAHYKMSEGNGYDISVDIRESFGHIDVISIVNVCLFKTAEFEYWIEN